MADTFTCPECGVRLRRSPELTPGARVQCPRCTIQFPVPEVETEALPPAPPAEDSPDLRFQEAPGPRSAGEGPDIDRAAVRRADDPPLRLPGRTEEEDDYPRPPAGEEDEDHPRKMRRIGHPDDLTNDYTIDAPLWFAYAKEHWGKILGQAVGYQVLLIVINQAIGAVIGAMALFAQPLLMAPLEAGLMIVCLAQLKGRPWTFSDFFGGFRYYTPILLVSLLKLGLMLAWMVPPGVAAITFMIVYDGPELVPPHLWFVLIGVLGALALPLLVVYLRLFFALPLILDRNYSAGEAISASWRLTRGHFLSLLGLHITFLGLLFLGFALCYVGVWFVVPYITLAAAAGYLLVAGTEPPGSRQNLQGAAHLREEED